MKHLDFTKLPPTSTSLILYIKRAYLQANRWYSILNDSECFQNPENFGYVEKEEGWNPQIILQQLPDDFPFPCSCKTCSRITICRCRMNSIACSRFCFCENSSKCRNDSDV